MNTPVGFGYIIWLIVWLIAPVGLFALAARRGRLGGFLVYSYLLSFIMNHWFGALVYASPWNRFNETTDTIVGFEYSTIGFVAFCVGVMLVPAPAPRLAMQRSQKAQASLMDLERLTRSLFFPLGLFCWVATFTPIASIPSASSILSVGKQSLILAVCLMCWSAWQRGDRRSFMIWLIASAVLPIITIASSGFIGYGIVMVTTILAFVSMFYRPRWQLLVALLVMLYGGVSLWVAYAEHRDGIRETVWGGQSAESRYGAIQTVVTSFKPFDISKPEQLEAVDKRLNQNALVGAAVRVTPAFVPFRDGETIYAAMMAVVPRAIWRDKPIVAGSGTYVSEHTMRSFAAGTSVGMGQVLEFYINFGIPGIVVGFVLLGAMLRYMDTRLAAALLESDWKRLTFFFIVGSGALQNGGALSEIVASMAAGAVLAFAASMALNWLTRRDQAKRRGPRAPRPALGPQ